MLAEGVWSMQVGDLVRGGKGSGMWDSLGIVLFKSREKATHNWWKVKFGSLTRDIMERELEVVNESR